MEWKRGHVIGRGSSAIVSIATSADSGRVFAVKSAELSQCEPLKKEAKILSSLNSPHVVKYIGNDITTEGNDNKIMFNLLIEYAPNGTLNDAVSATKGLDEPTIRRYTRKIVKGLSYLHSLGIVHCDIKGWNILVTGDGPKIADFGCAKTTESEKGVMGTPMFMAPEAARGDHQSPASDVWSLGCTVIEMSGSSPWPNSGDHVNVLYRIACSEDSPEIPGFLSEEARDFLEKCFRRKPEERWTAERLLTHPFLSRPDSEPGFTISGSPTSVLDPFCRVWGSESEAGVSGFSDGDSAAERIGRLAATEASDWSLVEGDDWITIRGDISGGNYGLEATNCELIRVDYEGEEHDYGRLRGNDGDLACEADNFRSLVTFERERNTFMFPLILRNCYS